MIWMRRILVALICIIGLLRLGLFSQSFYSPYVYMKDFIQEYLFARAVLDGVNPYTPLPQLAGEFIGPLPIPILPHSTPHPPPVIFLGLPFALLPYTLSTAVWGLLTLSFITLSIWLILDVLGTERPTLLLVALMTLVWIAWRPFLEELIYGQLMILLGLLLVLAWRLLRQDGFVLGGILLGLVFALKLMAWPLILFFVLKRQWKVVFPTTLTVLVLNLAAAVLISPVVLVDYYLNLSATVMPLYRSFTVTTQA